MQGYTNGTHEYRLDTQAFTGGEVHLGEEETFYVHLNSGRIVEVRPATSVRLTADAVEVLNGPDVVALFERDDVYFASDEDIGTPQLA